MKELKMKWTDFIFLFCFVLMLVAVIILNRFEASFI
jgi:hypothetical protein